MAEPVHTALRESRALHQPPAADSEAPLALVPRRRAAGAPRQARIARLLTGLDRLLGRQLDAILHQPRFQQLEASWRGLRRLVDTEATSERRGTVKIKLLDCSWAELARDLSRAIEFDQSHIFRRLYSDEFDTPGGEPFGVLLGDYQLCHRPRPGVRSADTTVMAELARVATAALCPFIAGADARLLGLDAWSELPQPPAPDALFQQDAYRPWRALRRDEHSRFIGLVLPRILMRAPWRDDGSRRDGFRYREASETHNAHCWGNAAYAFGAVLIRAFVHSGWFADIRGAEQPHGAGGVVADLPRLPFEGDRRGIAPRLATELILDDRSERELSESGLIALCAQPGGHRAVFQGNSSLHSPATFGAGIATSNARLSAMIQYMLCVSRFGHYLKLIGRDKIGSFSNATDCQRLLQNWLNRYTTAGDNASAALKAKYPLAASRVELREQAARPGHYHCVIHLQPHFQLDQLVSSIRLVTELNVGHPQHGGPTAASPAAGKQP
ncbi:type VI secretion system contractile sheath large subunit [Alkalilimnicola sp. S0819]|uniref:type VI secretion system contractile sheath large subunit n=1 Tax=Alkalilimnicola sp. S0819 TaxID=2613922 RepID=UPI001869AC4C|nr:type VI secretion system contractile sheath large subunit [Alkalilimnicola sp. S0819]